MATGTSLDLQIVRLKLDGKIDASYGQNGFTYPSIPISGSQMINFFDLYGE
ncbi:MAG: hypothetical protein HYZ71_10620 [Deltaproteobacteria bacterium]|nr:hypothetical protein [Deltaproteobacteria bacterium]